MPPKSMLKKTPAAKPANPQHLQVALHHANVLEERKRVEAEVLAAVMTLMDYPSTADADPKKPLPADARYLCEAVVSFQPADYDALIEERNISGKCGYALCPRPKQQARSAAQKHFVDTEHGVEIVDRKVLEVWCSDDCAKRALYVKVQLNEEPAWMRQSGYGDKIELLVESADHHHKALPLRLKQEGAAAAPADDDHDDYDDDADIADAWAAREDAMADLAVERGEKPGQPSKANNSLIKDQIKERTTTAPPPPPSLPVQSFENRTMAIEGHVPRSDRKDDDDDGDDEDDAQGWDKHLAG